jgi:hypothetical protein
MNNSKTNEVDGSYKSELHFVFQHISAYKAILSREII